MGWGERGGDSFLVAVHNVAQDQPYAILRAPASSTALDIIFQVTQRGTLGKESRPRTTGSGKKVGGEVGKTN